RKTKSKSSASSVPLCFKDFGFILYSKSKLKAQSFVEAQSIVILDFGSQYTQLIARRIRELKVFSAVLPCSASLDEIKSYKPAGIILSGGPSSVYDTDAPPADDRIWPCRDHNLPCAIAAVSRAAGDNECLDVTRRRSQGPAFRLRRGSTIFECPGGHGGRVTKGVGSAISPGSPSHEERARIAT